MNARGYAVDGDNVLVDDDLKGRALESPGSLNGAFGVVAGNTVVTDRLSTRPVYLGADGRASFDFWRLAEGHRPNALAAVELLTYGYALGQHTLCAKVSEAPAASVTRWRDGEWASARYWRYAPTSGRSTAADLADTFEQMGARLGKVCAAVGLDKPGLNLTAGRDSRLVAALLRTGGVQVEHYFTTADLGAEEVTARRLAKALGGEHTTVPMWWRDGREQPPGKVLWAVGPTTLYTVSNNPMNLALAGPFPVTGFISGHLGDVFSGDHLTLRTRQISMKGQTALSRYIAESWARVPQALLESILRPEHRALAREAREHLRDIARDVEVESPAHAHNVVDIEQRQRRFILRDYNALLTLGKSVAPLSDHAYMDFFEKVPLRWQYGSSLYTSGLAEFFRRHGPPELLSVPANGKLLRPVRIPELHLATDSVRARVEPRLRRVAPVPAWPQVEHPGDWVHSLGWLCHVDAVQHRWTDLPVFLRRGLETVARVSQRLCQGIGSEPEGNGGMSS